MSDRRATLLANIVESAKYILELDHDIRTFKKFRKDAKKNMKEDLEKLREYDF